MDFAIRGRDLKVWVDGKALPDSAIHLLNEMSLDGINRYKVIFPEKRQRIGTIAFSIAAHIGNQGTAVLAEPVKLKTGTGLLLRGNWAKTGALRCYSGGMIYKQNIRLPKKCSDKKFYWI